jgi:hypothetical protein
MLLSKQQGRGRFLACKGAARTPLLKSISVIKTFKPINATYYTLKKIFSGT